ncbi:LacI family DNA-binding transcriptional regulator [Luteipulveratus mongoliensis]|uniref:LacI family DNA-binding transcriptional regulator n=1 Tax=Luteipulveratus mongoliensis TaxID=571913 RepID=UPI000B1734DC|nr:LacI family DNA-binding transcriptional regulator [Luteipulveratus mongoliensis]
MAELAGVSAATVSRVLNNVPTVDADLAERVRDAANELGYRANGVARSLRRQRTDVWALIISDIGNPFFTSVARGVEDIAQREGFSVVLCNTDEDPAKEARYIDVAEREQVAGVVMSPNAFGSDISRLTAAGIPVVAIDRPLREPVDSVLVSSADGARLATEHLFEQGWTRPACVTGPARADTAEQRLAGYRDAFAALRRRPAKSLVRHTDYRAESAREAVASLLDSASPPDSFFLANSSLALGALQEFRRRGLLPGRDVGLVSFDDPPWAGFVNPPMSVVVQPTYEIGVQAGELLLKRIGHPLAGKDARTITLSTELIVRDSSLHKPRRTRAKAAQTA